MQNWIRKCLFRSFRAGVATLGLWSAEHFAHAQGPFTQTIPNPNGTTTIRSTVGGSGGIQITIGEPATQPPRPQPMGAGSSPPMFGPAISAPPVTIPQRTFPRTSSPPAGTGFPAPMPPTGRVEMSGEPPIVPPGVGPMPTFPPQPGVAPEEPGPVESPGIPPGPPEVAPPEILPPEGVAPPTPIAPPTLVRPQALQIRVFWREAPSSPWMVYENYRTPLEAHRAVNWLRELGFDAMATR